MRLGSIGYDGTRFRLHVHVIAADSPEVSEFRTFRDRLRGEPMLLGQYVALKRGIIAEGSRIRSTIRSARGSSSLASSATDRSPR